MEKIAILYTTFMRDSLMKETVKSILDNWQENYILLIGDQNPSEEKLHKYSSENIYYYGLPFDCGVSYARNYLVEKARELDCKYCLLSADSIKFEKKYDFNVLIDFLENKQENGIVGISLKNRQYWVYNIDLIPGKYFYLTNDNLTTINYKGIDYICCEVIANVFLAKTKCLIDNKWDNELKMAEHEDFFWRLKQTNYKTYYTNYISLSYINDKPEEYNKYRRRLYAEFKRKLQEKYQITGWLNYKRY